MFKNKYITSVIISSLLLGCQTKVPDKITHEVTGKTVSENIIRIEISLPPELVQAYDISCGEKCQEGDVKCKEVCNSNQLSNYTNTILSLISSLNETLKPPQ